MPEPRLVGMPAGTSTGLFSTLALDPVEHFAFCGMPPALITRSTRTPYSAMRSRMMRVWKAVPRWLQIAHPARCERGPAQCHAAQFRIHPAPSGRHCPSSAATARSVLPCNSPIPQTARPTVVLARRAMASKISPVAERPGLRSRYSPDARFPGPRRTRRNQLRLARHGDDACGVPTTFTTSPSRMLEPMASQCASKAPTGIGIPARRPSASAHSAERMPAR